MQSLRLPNEILGLVVDALRPENPDALLSPKDEATKTWLSMMTVCKALYGPAARALRDHCVYLDSRERTQAFCRCLELSPPPFRKGDSKDLGLKAVKSMFVASFPEDDGFNPIAEVISKELAARVEKLSYPAPIEIDPDYHEELSSDDSELVISALDDLTTAMALYEIFHAVGPTLKRLVIDMPLRTLWIPDDTKGIKKTLWCGFEALGQLEEFTSIRDEFFLVDKAHGGGWNYNAWPKLRRLSLYNPDLDLELRDFRRKKVWFEEDGLELLVTSRADCLVEGVRILRYTYGEDPKGWFRSPGELTKVHIDMEGLSPMLEDAASTRLHLINKVLTVDGPGYGDDASTWPISPRELVQEHLLKRSLEGTLWSWAMDGVVLPCSSDDNEEQPEDELS